MKRGMRFPGRTATAGLLQPEYSPGQIEFHPSSVKAAAFPYGASKFGVSDNYQWLGANYDEATYAAQIQYMIDTWGIHDFVIWLWLDQMATKGATWGTTSYVPTWNATYKTNWENFLEHVILDKSCQVLVTMAIVGSDSADYQFEQTALLPDVEADRLIDVGVANGGMEDPGPPTTPTGWTGTTAGSSTITYQAVSSGSPPLGGLNEAVLECVAGGLVTLETPHVAYNQSLTRIDIDLRASGTNTCIPVIKYYDSEGVEIDSYTGSSFAPGTEWGALTWGTLSRVTRTYNLDASVASVAIQIRTSTNGTIYVGAVRMFYGSRSVKAQNYLDLYREWVLMYNERSKLGSAILTWDPINEPYDAASDVGADAIHGFCHDVYQEIHRVTSEQAVLLDSGAFQSPYSTAGNEWLYNDACGIVSFHWYKDDATIPTNMLNMAMRKIVGECGPKTTPTAGTQQVERCTLTGSVTTGGSMVITIASVLVSTTVNFDVATGDSANKVAEKARRALLADATVAAYYSLAAPVDGSVQIETATVVGTITTSGNATVIVTATDMPNSPKTFNVAVTAGDTASTVAWKIRKALAADADVSSWVAVAGSDANIVLKNKIVATDDTAMNISIDNGTCAGLTTALTSTDTDQGAPNNRVDLKRRLQNEVHDDNLEFTIAKVTAVGSINGPASSTPTGGDGVKGNWDTTDATVEELIPLLNAAEPELLALWAWNGTGWLTVQNLYPVITGGPAATWYAGWTP